MLLNRVHSNISQRKDVQEITAENECGVWWQHHRVTQELHTDKHRWQQNVSCFKIILFYDLQDLNKQLDFIHNFLGKKIITQHSSKIFFSRETWNMYKFIFV